MSQRISLTEQDFKNLVRGQVIEVEGVKIALQDIGFDRMRRAVDEADGWHSPDGIR